ncbi:excisionase family DNA-binding protein [Arcobacter sp.]|uniref:excisionase family DNA-binding protein n=1 Tax=unclassified Arcobacter TaxID=2593671 RepID=UPI003B005A37
MSTLIAIDDKKINEINEKINILINLFQDKKIYIDKDEYKLANKMSISKGAKYLAMSEQFIRDRIKDGTLTAERIGTRIIRIEKSQLDKLKTTI